jgi:transcriptional regulator with XRE-family HTH domain
VAERLTRSQFSPSSISLREWLVAARHRRGLTQVELAETLGRKQSFVSKYERGERRLDFVEIIEISDALGADIGDLVAQIRRRT